MPPKKKADDKEKEPEAKKPEEKSGPKRMVLKTLKRASVAPPSPTLHRVTGIMTRRVVPKAPPPKPVPVAPPVPPPPVTPPPPKVALPHPTPLPAGEGGLSPSEAKPKAPAPAIKETKKPLEIKKEPAKSEPT